MIQINPYWIYLPHPSTVASRKFFWGFPTTNVLILVVTVTRRRLVSIYIYMTFTCMMLRFCFYNMFKDGVCTLNTSSIWRCQVAYNVFSSSHVCFYTKYLTTLIADMNSMIKILVQCILLLYFDRYFQHELSLRLLQTPHHRIGRLCPRSWLTLTEARAVYKLNCDKVEAARIDA